MAFSPETYGALKKLIGKASGVQKYDTMAEMKDTGVDGDVASCNEAAYKGLWLKDTTLPSDPVKGQWSKITGASEINLSQDLIDNEWNAANVTFLESPQLIKVGLKYILNAYVELKSPISDVGTERIKILEVPHSEDISKSDYADVTNVGGYHTCENNRHEFFDSDGGHYKTENDFVNTKKTIQSVANVIVVSEEDEKYKAFQRVKQADYSLMETPEGLPDFDKVVHQIDSTGAVKTDGTPDTDNQYSYKFILPKTNYGYEEEEMEKGDNCNTWKDVPCYGVGRVEPKCSKEYLLWVWRHQNGCNVDTQGKIGTYSFIPSSNAAYFMPTDKYGYEGTYEFTPTEYEEITRVEPILLQDGEVTLRAGITAKRALISIVF